jgi:2-keto-4-pentenoate hydratase/2-oxohepta-3-ene-1,7-dioic acid hydratase in catechol pathway
MMNYSAHKTIAGDAIDLPVTKAVCIGQNYADHIKELNSTTAPEALFFMKPSTALCDASPSFTIPTNRGECHNELELAILISEPLCQATPEQAQAAIWGVGLALDLTLREVQQRLKSLGRPWEVAKGFDGALPLTGFVPVSQIRDLQDLSLTLQVNGEVRQQGNTQAMIRPVLQLLSEMSEHFTLLPGDIVLTGTPAGVGPLQANDRLLMTLEQQSQLLIQAQADVN